MLMIRPQRRLIIPRAACLVVKNAPFKFVSSTVFQSSRSEEHTSELQSQSNLVCRLLLEKKIQECEDLGAGTDGCGPQCHLLLGATLDPEQSGVFAADAQDVCLAVDGHLGVVVLHPASAP